MTVKGRSTLSDIVRDPLWRPQEPASARFCLPIGSSRRTLESTLTIQALVDAQGVSANVGIHVPFTFTFKERRRTLESTLAIQAFVEALSVRNRRQLESWEPFWALDESLGEPRVLLKKSIYMLLQTFLAKLYRCYRGPLGP